MTDLERIELACRRIADRERTRLTTLNRGDRHTGETPEPVDLQMIKIFEALAAELSPLRTADAFPSRCPHGKWMTEECNACNGTMYHRYIVGQR